PALPRYQICGFATAAMVGSSASIASSPRIMSSSRMLQSPVKPRPEPFDRAMKRSVCPVCSSIDSSPTVYRYALTRLCRSGHPRMRRSIRLNADLAVLNSCAECRMSCSPPMNSPHSSRASMMPPLPFWRGTLTTHSNADQEPSRSSPIPRRSTYCCHGSRCSPARAARSMASWPALDTDGGTVSMGGCCQPYTRPSSPSAGGLLAGSGPALLSLSSDVIDGVPLLPDRGEPAKVGHHSAQLSGGCGLGGRGVGFVDGAGQAGGEFAEAGRGVVRVELDKFGVDRIGYRAHDTPSTDQGQLLRPARALDAVADEVRQLDVRPGVVTALRHRHDVVDRRRLRMRHHLLHRYTLATEPTDEPVTRRYLSRRVRLRDPATLRRTPSAVLLLPVQALALPCFRGKATPRASARLVRACAELRAPALRWAEPSVRAAARLAGCERAPGLALGVGTSVWL